MSTTRNLATALIVGLTTLVSAAPAGAAPPAQQPGLQTAGELASLRARIMFETVIDCDDEGDSTCLCTHLGTATPEVRSPDGTRIQARRMQVSVLAPCDLPDRIQVRGPVAAMTTSNGKKTALIQAGGELTTRDGTPVLAMFGASTDALLVAGTSASITFDPSGSEPVEVPYAPGADGYLIITMENNVLYTPRTDGFATWTSSTGT